MTTALQQIINDEEEARRIIRSLKNPPDPDEEHDIQVWDFALKIEPEDVPVIIEELEELIEDG